MRINNIKEKETSFGGGSGKLTRLTQNIGGKIQHAIIIEQGTMPIPERLSCDLIMIKDGVNDLSAKINAKTAILSGKHNIFHIENVTNLVTRNFNGFLDGKNPKLFKASNSDFTSGSTVFPKQKTLLDHVTFAENTFIFPEGKSVQGENVIFENGSRFENRAKDCNFAHSEIDTPNFTSKGKTIFTNDHIAQNGAVKIEADSFSGENVTFKNGSRFESDAKCCDFTTSRIDTPNFISRGRTVFDKGRITQNGKVIVEDGTCGLNGTEIAGGLTVQIKKSAPKETGKLFIDGGAYLSGNSKVKAPFIHFNDGTCAGEILGKFKKVGLNAKINLNAKWNDDFLGIWTQIRNARKFFKNLFGRKN